MNYDSQKGKDFLKSIIKMKKLEVLKFQITLIDNQIRDYYIIPHKLIKYHDLYMNEIRNQINRCEEILDVLKTQLMSETKKEVKNYLKKHIQRFNNRLKSLNILHHNIIKSLKH